VRLLRVPGDLPGERGPLIAMAPLDPSARAALSAVLEGSSRGAAIEADNLEALAALPDGVVDLVYADPPFATGTRQRLVSIRTGQGTQTRRGFRDQEVTFEAVKDLSWDDGLSLDQHLAALEARIRAVHRVLAPHGSLYLHVDWRTVHHVRLLLDEVFGPERFLNELIWAYDYGGRARDRWPRKHDTILWYAKGDTWRFDREAIDRVPYMAPGLVGPEKAARGKLPTDVHWQTIVPTSGRERTGYPTQKPEGLLRRFVQASSRPGGWCLDCFAGSGTLGAVAAALGRRYVLVDSSPEAIAVASSRLSAASA
jgi:site-specific DNA-methyltransferase (adenine-specific)